MDISTTAPAPTSGVVLPIDAVMLSRSLDETCFDDHSRRARVFGNAATTVAAFLGGGGHDTDTVVAAAELYTWLRDMQSREARQITCVFGAVAVA